jgi:hypothetical protein
LEQSVGRSLHGGAGGVAGIALQLSSCLPQETELYAPASALRYCRDFTGLSAAEVCTLASETR